MELPKNESVFDIQVEGDTTFKKYEGQFTVRCVLSMGQKHGMELEKTRLLGNHANPSEELLGLAIIFANLRAKVIDGPEWWKQSNGGVTIKDENVLVELYNQVEKAENEWRSKVKEMATPKAEAPSLDSQTL
jgi:hypothetical protein